MDGYATHADVGRTIALLLTGALIGALAHNWLNRIEHQLCELRSKQWQLEAELALADHKRAEDAPADKT